MSSGYAIVGRIRKPHGIRGELVVEPICDEPGETFAPGRHVFVGDAGAAPESAPTRELEVTRSRPFKENWLVSVRGIADRNEAELWRDRLLFVPASGLRPLASGQVFLHDLAGMRVVDVRGTEIGTVNEFESLPQGILLNVKTPDGFVSVPFVDAIVVGVDRDARTLTIDPPDGLLEL